MFNLYYQKIYGPLKTKFKKKKINGGVFLVDSSVFCGEFTWVYFLSVSCSA